MEILQTSVIKRRYPLAEVTWRGCFTAALSAVRVTITGFLQVQIQIF